MIFNSTSEFEGLDKTASLSNTIGLPLFFFLFSLVIPGITQNAINVRRALKRYDEQPTYPAPAPLTEDEKRAETRTMFHKQLVRACYGFVAYVIVMLFMTSAPYRSFREVFTKFSPSVILGIFLSETRPFNIFTRVDKTSYIRRSKNNKAGGRPTTVQLVEIPTEPEVAKMSPRLQQFCKIIWPAVFGLCTAISGLFVPFLWVCYKSIRLVPFMPQGASLKFLALLYNGFLALITFTVVVVIALVMHFHPDGSPDKPKSKTRDSDTFAAVNASYVLVMSMFPLYTVLAAACNYDLKKLEQNGDLESELALLRGDVPQLDSQAEKTVVPVLNLDENGKQPEIVQCENFHCGKGLISIYFRITSKTDVSAPIADWPKLPLPTFSSALCVLQAITFVTVVAVIMAPFEVFDKEWMPDMPWLHPITLGALFGEDALDRSDALFSLVALAYAWAAVVFQILIITVLVSALRQHGFEGLKTMWSNQDRIWFEGPASTVLAPVPEDVAGHPTDAALLVDVSC